MFIFVSVLTIKINHMKFVNRAQAKKTIGVSYLGTTEISSKLLKNKKVNNIMTYCIYVAPAKTSGYEVCPNRTKECTAGCLATSGRVKMENETRTIISDARLKKAKLFVEHKDFFMGWVIAEITAYKFKAERLGYGFAIRINGTSDIDLNTLKINGFTLFEIFPDVQFYDYTKQYSRFENIPENYHLTFSYSGRNIEQAKNLLQRGFNIAVVFDTKKGKDFPKTFLGYPVIDGDLTDYRPYDQKNSVVGLRWKTIKDKMINEQIKNSVFCVNEKSDFCKEFEISETLMELA